MNDGNQATIPVLDHGYVRLVESWGSDRSIIEAARMSTDKGFLGWEAERVFRCMQCKYLIVRSSMSAGDAPICPTHHTILVYDEATSHAGDAALLRALWTGRNRKTPPHTSPFEMAGFIIEVQAPIFVFREWHRHRTQSYNEMSARYVPLPNLNYMPSIDRLLQQQHDNKQAGTLTGVDALTPDAALGFQRGLAGAYAVAEETYQEALRRGVTKELARLIVPVGRYSRMRASANLLNWTKFLTLRLHSSAQWEIRQYAIVVADIMESLFPRTYALFDETRHRG